MSLKLSTILAKKDLHKYKGQHNDKYKYNSDTNLKLSTFLANKDEEKEKEKVEEKVPAVECCFCLKLELLILYFFSNLEF